MGPLGRPAAKEKDQPIIPDFGRNTAAQHPHLPLLSRQKFSFNAASPPIFTVQAPRRNGISAFAGMAITSYYARPHWRLR
jgi:hypothetical protein